MTSRPPRPPPHWTGPERSPPRTAADARAANPAVDPATASQDEAPDQTHVVFFPPSQLLTIKVLRRSLESTQYVSIRYTQRLAEAGIEASVGRVGDSYDNALAETIHGLDKTEVIRRQGPWRTLEQVEFATLAWVDWFQQSSPARLDRAHSAGRARAGLL
jgi:transposase InsO family protein